MTDATRLTVKPSVIAGETAPAYLLRAFGINGKRWNRERLAADGLAIAGVVHGDADAAVEAYVGQGIGPFVAIDAKSLDANRIMVGGETLRRDDWTSRDRRWCPACWKDDLASAASGRHPHWNIHRRHWWDVTAIGSCPIHDVALKGDCPTCGVAIGWHDGSLTRCKEGHSLLVCEAVTVAPDEKGADAYLVGRLGGMPRIPCAALDELTLAAAVEVMERLGLASLGEDEGIDALRERLGRGRLLAEGFRIASGLPGTAPELLDTLQAGEAERPGRWGLLRAYGGFHGWLKVQPEGLLVNTLRTALLAHADGNVTLKTGITVGGGSAPELDRMTLLAASEACGISHERLRRIAVALGMLDGSKRQGAPSDLRPDQIEELARLLRGHKNLDVVAGELGVPDLAVKRMVAAGLIQPLIPRTGRTGPGTWMFAGDAATHLLERIAAYLQPRDHVRVRLASLPRSAQIARTSTAAVIDLVLKGKIPVFAGEGVGLTGIDVPVIATRIALRRDRNPGLTCEEFAARAALPVNAAYELIKRGLVQGRRVGRSWLVPEIELQRYADTFVGAPELASAMGLRRAVDAIEALAAIGTTPVCDRPAFNKVLYDRATAHPAATAWRASRPARPARRVVPPGLTGKEFARRAGLDRALVLHMMRNGSIENHEGPGRYPIVPESEIERVAREFASGTELAAALGAESGMAVVAVMRKAGVEPTHSLPRGGYHLYPREPALEAVRRHLAVRMEEDAERSRDAIRVNARDASTTLGVTDVMLGQLARAGLLPAERKGRQVLFDKDGLDAFARAFVLGNELDAMIGSSGGAATKLLRRKGVTPVCDRPAFYSVVFRREEAVGAIGKGPRL